MSDQGNFQLSQGYEVLAPRSGQAYPIPCDEWTLLKSRISKLTSEPWLFLTAGSLLLGVALSTLSTILIGTFKLPAQQQEYYSAWAICAATGLSGAACLFFSHKERAVHRERAGDVVSQMDLIEKRYERAVQERASQRGAA